MVVRHHQIDFASGALVFPGGKVDKRDSLVRGRCEGGNEDDDLLTLQVAAIREAFEECGILLARPAGSDQLISGERLKTLEHFRQPLAVGDMGIGEFLEQEDLFLACDQLVPYAHWVTPEMMPKRFDTHFYLAIAPADHLAIHDGHESVDSVWISPADALAGASDGTYTIIFPTRLNVEMLAMSDSVNGAIADANAREIVTVLPWMEKREDGNYICLPADAGYAVTAEKMTAGA
ncbi:MAG: 8-oxo-dGTP pyrophosphatase MutT (NUDIX family) [Candidatus Azotimanducaceae bacterium]|jgi:8-oxo-dGTP pyrophosphatase MutT (NUDIX family)